MGASSQAASARGSGGPRMTRREWLRSAGAVAAVGWASPRRLGREMPAIDAVDHLLLGVSDLDRGIAWFEQRSGVRAVAGGSHPGRGTRNALAALGGRRYLEIIALDPAQDSYQFHLDIRTLETPRLITWAAAVPDLDGAIARAARAGFATYGPESGSRRRPDGRTLGWRTAGITTRIGQGSVEPIPFLIAWADGSVHPSSDSPAGCTLEALDIEHPEPDSVRKALDALGLRTSVTRQPAIRLTARLQTPKGSVDLS
jgi:Glyoxalase-like domain